MFSVFGNPNLLLCQLACDILLQNHFPKTSGKKTRNKKNTILSKQINVGSSVYGKHVLNYHY